MDYQEPNSKTETSRRNGPSIRDELGWGKTERTHSDKAIKKERSTRRKRAAQSGDKKTSLRKKKSEPKKPKIILQSIPTDDDSNSWSDDSYESTDLDVNFESADEDLDNNVILARVRRLGNQKQSWKNDKEFYAVALAYLISPDAIVSAIYGMRKFGVGLGTPLFLCACFIAFPVMFLELALGQFTSSSSFSTFKFMVPAFSGLSALMTIMNMTMLLNDYVLFAMTLTLVSDSLQSVRRVSSCFNQWNDLTCQNAINPCEGLRLLTGYSYISVQGRCVQERWYTKILSKDLTNAQNTTFRQHVPSFQYLVSYLTSVTDMGDESGFFPSEHLLLYTSVTFGLILLTNRLASRTIVLLCKFTFVMLLVFISTVTFTTHFYLPNDFVAFEIEPIHNNSTWDLPCWLVAHTLIVSKIGQGGLIALGSQNPFGSNIFKSTSILVIVAFIIPHAISYIVHPFMDNMLWRTVKDYNLYEKYEQEYFGSHGFGFNTIWSDTMSSFFASFNEGNLLGNLFIATVLSVFFAHKIVRIKTLLMPAIERFGIDVKIDLEIIRRVYLVWIVLIFWMKMLIPHKTESFFATMGGASVIVCYEIVCVFGFYGPRRFLSNLNLMMFGMVMNGQQDLIKVRVRQIYNLSVVILFSLFVGCVPLYLLSIVGISAYRYLNVGGTLFVAVVFPTFFLLFVPVVAGVKIFSGWRRNQLAVNLFKPVSHLWGPKEERDRKRAENEERQLRI